MNYNDKIDRIKNSIYDFIKSKIVDIYNIEECYREFKVDNLIFDIGLYYISKFEEEFYGYIKKNISVQLNCNGRNIGYAIKTYIKLNKNCTVNNVYIFANEFLTTQFTDFDNWCYDLQMSYSDKQDIICIEKKTL